MKLIKLLILIVFVCSINAQLKDLTKSNSDFSELNLISVTIGGDFIVTGSFPASRTERIDQFVTRIYNNALEKQLTFLSTQTQNQLTPKIQKHSIRNIKLKKMKGQEKVLDLEKFRNTGDFSHNPFLEDGDVLIFSSIDLEREFIAIDGAINKPGKYQFVQGDKLSDIILLAQGIKNSLEPSSIAISRLTNSGNKEQIINLKLEEDYDLLVGDRIKVLYDENKKSDYRVLILGEVLSPGYHFITKDSTKLFDAILKAGGLKNTADLLNSEVIRNYNTYDILRKFSLEKDIENGKLSLKETLNKNEQKELYEKALMMRSFNRHKEDSLFFQIDEKVRLMRNYSPVDFRELKIPGSEAYNFFVKDGDVIIIPEQLNKIYVYGQVSNVGYYDYKPGESYDYYINRAGGLTSEAEDISEITLIKSKTREWKKITGNQIEPGDYIYIPKVQKRNLPYYLSNISQAVSIVGGLGTLILLILQLNK